MKFVSLFGKTPNYKRFNYTPRHYDPIEDERKKREEEIRRELEAGLRVETKEELELRQSKIKGSFQAARRRSAQKGAPSIALVRTIITLFIVILLWAFLQFGTIALYGLILVVPFYLFLKLKNFKRS
jgi:Flp pilus assembly protein TadB